MKKTMLNISERIVPIYMVLFLLFSGLFLPVNCYAEVKCTHQLLVNIIQQLDERGIHIESEGNYDCRELNLATPLLVQKDNDGLISHIGLKLFDRKLFEQFPSPLYHFMERYFLELVLIKDDQTLGTKLHQERVKINSDIYPDVPLLSGIKKMLGGFSPDCSMFISSSNNRYHVLVTKNNQALCSMYFPMRYEMITGQTKLEAESSFYGNLKNFKSDSISSSFIKKTDLLPYKDSLYMVNDAYYMSEEIRSNSYYAKDHRGIFLLKNKKYGVESVCNLFNASHRWQVTAQVTQKMYGNKNYSFEVPLYELMDYLRSEHCDIYVGIRKFNRNKIDGVVLCLNSELGYQHLIPFTLPGTFLEQDTPVKVKMAMYSFTPIHNVSSLLESK